LGGRRIRGAIKERKGKMKVMCCRTSEEKKKTELGQRTGRG